SGCPSQSTSSASPPAARICPQSHSPASRTSAAWASSALMLGMAIHSPSRSISCSTMSGGVYEHKRGDARRRRVTPFLRANSGDVAESVRLRNRAELLEALVLDLPDPLARDVER